MFSNIQSSTKPLDPIQITAPPSPPFPVSVLFKPVASLFVKLEPTIVPFKPFQYTAPPALFAVLFSNVEFSILPFVAPSYQSIAPPFVPATLFSK